MSLNKCGICFEDFQLEGVRCPKRLPCSHIYCLRCLRKKLQRKLLCPGCEISHVVPGGKVTNFPTIDQRNDMQPQVHRNYPKNDTNCGVCAVKFQLSGENSAKLLPCSHVYCLQCLRGRVYYGLRCPGCEISHKVSQGSVSNFPTEVLPIRQPTGGRRNRNHVVDVNDGYPQCPGFSIF